ncbi:MAG: chemotaxis protein CheA [Desulfotignum sp.]|jgi:two-component system chemotaxis sensor kinase CheA|nr:chemotaxis protein CheA [Desulfotignum sp.]
MPYEIMKDLIEKFSCELVLADPEDSQTMSGLLPVLKKMHGECIRLSLQSQAGEVIRARDLITRGISGNDTDADQRIASLETFIKELSHAVTNAGQSENRSKDTASGAVETDPGDTADAEGTGAAASHAGAADPAAVSGEASISDHHADLETKLDELTLLIGGFCPGEMPVLGDMLNNLDELMAVSKHIAPSLFHDTALACKKYVETMTMEETSSTRPVEEGLVLLKSILSHMKRNEPFAFDCSDVLELLEIRFSEEKTAEPEQQAPAADNQAEPENKAPVKISGDDMEILIDFVSEAQENLETIEVNLIDLEQDPENMEIINNIFRPFHTIKGVSGFLSLNRINRLAHATENLLDSARSGEFIINDTATDVILESVDTLKQLIERVSEGINTGFMPKDDDIDVDSLRDKLQTLQRALIRGDREPLGEILVKRKMVDQASLDQALADQKNHPDRKIGEILVDAKKVQPGQVASALMDQVPSRKKPDTQVKVSTRKLDDLVDYAGELVIAQSMLKQKTMDYPLISQNVSQLGQIVTNMQTIAMSMRMISIKATFMKMIRLVRDLAKKSGKEVNLTMQGEDTEIDRNVVDALYEPMVHMIRNSVDHGIEAVSHRLEKGKPSQGEIVLRAYHKGGHIMIEIEDDGKGLDRDAILEKAKQTGLVTGKEQMTDAQVYDLIMQPGFSTAKQITDVSGRGVGMDVVKSGLEKFRGQLQIASKKGRGTKFTISLPLTLAIIDGMLVRVDEEKYVIPTMAIQKAFKPAKEECFTVEGKGEMVKDRGSLIPVIRLNNIYKTDRSNEKKPVHEGLVVVVESKDEKRAFLIDELLGKDEYVIKSLGAHLEGVEGLAGGAILADGRVGLILDVHGIFGIR